DAMNSITACLDRAYDKATDIGAHALVDATNFTGRMMNTRVGRATLVVPLATAMTAARVYAEEGGGGNGGDAQGMIDGIMGVLGPGIIALGSLVAVVGGIQTGVGFKDDNADGKTRGFQTLIGGAIIGAVGALIPSSISLSGGGGG
ncbi:MAG: hypothetical protein II695_05240, partial [Oscillospiraceae bacterium]|nr:hypothetical protein [Oscillospiraceae bacterium]